jgi:alpha-L-rhamnosidase
MQRDDLAEDWDSLADSLSEAINNHLWNEEKQAYTDCSRSGEHSKVYSQQTQTVAFMSGVAQGERAERCQSIMKDPPEGFVKAGSPFFEFFLLEAYTREGEEQKFLDTIRNDWGFMIDMGATTFWEMWSGREGRLTRSHCHAWSAAPTFFLSTYVLGVTPETPGFASTVIEPHPADLTWARGTVPTPYGNIEVQWENEQGKPFTMRIKSPEEIELDIRLPRDGSVTVNGVEV